MPKLYDGWFNDQVAKQASAAVGRAISAGKKKIEVNFPPVPNVEGMHAGAVLDLVFRPSPVDRSTAEVRFGTPLNQKFGKNVVAK